MEPSTLLQLAGLAATAGGVFLSLKIRADITEMKSELKEWARDKFSDKADTARRLEVLEDRPSNRPFVTHLN